MTNEDAIRWLDNLKNDIGNPHYERLWPYAQAIDEICSLLKEQEAKPVKVVKTEYNHKLYYCPRCDRPFCDFYYVKPKFCDKCGQELKWNECSGL